MAGTLAGRTRALASCGSARMTMRRVRLLAVLAIAAVLLVACRPGDIDASFGTNGVVTFGPNFDLGQAIVVPDGRIVVPGTLLSRTDPSHISLRRLNVNGTPDTNFGNQGVVDTFVGHGSGALVLVRQPDDKLVVGGFVEPGAGMPPPTELALLRYLPDGALDASFGNGGVVVSDLGSYDAIVAVVLQLDGKIVAVSDGNHGTLVVRLNPDGSADTTFGWAGIVGLGGHFAAGGPPHVLVQPDGKLVIGASGVRPNDPVGTAVFQLVRLTPTGTRDASFGDNGVVSTDFGFGVDRESFLRGLVLRAGGKLLAAGATDDASGREMFALARYNSDGTLDSTFGTGGRVTHAMPSTNPFNVFAFATQRYGAVVLAGIDYPRAVLARFGPAGDFDTNFGSGGIATSTAIQSVDVLTSQPNGALLAGSRNGGQLARFAG